MDLKTMFGYKVFANLFGWFGAAITILAYVLISFSILDATNILYQILNLTGAVGVAVVSIIKRIYQPATLEIIWVCIALVALLNIIL